MSADTSADVPARIILQYFMQLFVTILGILGSVHILRHQLLANSGPPTPPCVIKIIMALDPPPPPKMMMSYVNKIPAYFINISTP